MGVWLQPLAGEKTRKLNIWAFALAFGIWWGVGVFLITWWIIAVGGGTGEPTFLARIYLGYEISALGSVVGLVWGLIDGLIAGAILAWGYNLAADKIPFGRQVADQSPE